MPPVAAPEVILGSAHASGTMARIWLDSPRSLQLSYSGKGNAAGLLRTGNATALSMAQGDLNGDGIADLVVGYTTASGGAIGIHRGNLDARAPQSSKSFWAIANGQFPDPFLPQVQVIDVPVTPDFVAVADIDGDGRKDIIIGSKSSATIYALLGDGKGNFPSVLQVSLPSTVTALAAHRIERANANEVLLVAVNAVKDGQPQLLAFTATKSGLLPIFSLTLPGTATAFAFGDLDHDGYPDTALSVGGQVYILHGSDVHAAAAKTGSAHLETVGLSVNAASVDIGTFINDRDARQQIAVMGSDGSVSILTRAGLDTKPWSTSEWKQMHAASMRGKNAFAVTPARESWIVAESFTGIGGGSGAIMLRTRVSGNGLDDIVIADPRSGQLHQLSHGNVRKAQDLVSGMSPSVHLTTSLAGKSPAAMVAMHVNIDARPGLVMVSAGHVAPTVLMPLPDPTFTVNTTADPAPPTDLSTACAGVANDCSLRSAILKANATAGTDTVMVPAGTYTLTIQPAAGYDTTGYTGALAVLDGVSIVGAGQGATIITGGMSFNDKIFGINPNFDTPFNTSISNLTISNGANQQSYFSGDGDGGAIEFEASGTGVLTLTNCTVQQSSTVDGDGGGIAADNELGGSGGLIVTNSAIQNNTVNESTTGGSGIGGGIFLGSETPMTVTNSTIQGNSANQSQGQGGGVYLYGPAETVEFHGTTVIGNNARSDGGGIYAAGGITIDQLSMIVDNHAGGNGGGLWLNVVGEESTISNSTFMSNSASGNGGAIHVDSSASDFLSLSYNRFAANTASTGGSNLYNGGGVVSAADNWWGTNTPLNTIDEAGGSTTYLPYIALQHTASPSKVRVNQSSTLTASVAYDNNGNPVGSGNLGALAGLQVTFGSADLGTIPNAQPETLSPFQSTATFNAGSNAGNGSAVATVDQAAVTASITILQPPSITASFNPSTVTTSASSTLTFSITSGNSVTVDANFTDTLPANLVVATTPNVVNGCGGTVTATAGAGSISFSNTTLAVGTCTIQVSVQASTDGVYNNSVTIDSTDAGNGNTSSAILTAIRPPQIAKTFAVPSVPYGAVTQLNITITNPNTNSTLTGISFTDTFPSGLVVASAANLSSTCSGTTSSSAASLSLSGSTLTAGASCTVSVNVQGSAIAGLNNSVSITSTNGGTGNTSTASLSVTKANTNTTVTASQNPSIFGQAVQFTATVTDISTGSAAPTGSIQFVVDGVNFGSPVALTGVSSNSSAATSQAMATLPVAGSPHTVTANYINVDGLFGSSTGSLLGGQTVLSASTSSTVISAINPSTYGQSVTFTATVSDNSPSSTATPTGSVQFVVDGVNVGSPVALTGASSNSSMAMSQATTALAVSGSPHTVIANYVNVDGSFSNSTGALIGGQTVTQAATSTNVTSSLNPATAGQSVSFTAGVTNLTTSSVPTGSIQFVVDGVNFGSPVPLIASGANSSAATSPAMTTLSPTGSPHTVTANYVNADGNFSNSTGTLAGGQTVTAVSTNTAISASQGTITLGDTVTFTAVVTAASGTPAGIVTFFDGTTPIGSGVLNLAGGNEQATFSTSLLSAVASPHSITAVYSGTSSFISSSSSPTSETVNPRTSSTGIVVNPTSVSVGQPSTVTVTVTDSGSVPPGSADVFSTTGAPATGRAGFTSTLFADGLVLVAGGANASGNVLGSAEIYSVSGASFTSTGNLNTARTGATAVLLPNGKVLIAGGSGDGTANGALNTAELFDPTTGTFTSSSQNMTAARYGATATLLSNGLVLLAGGENSGGVLNSAELYNPTSDSFTTTGNLNTARTGGAATLLGSGLVLVVGGSSDGTANGALSSIELFDPTAGGGAGAFKAVTSGLTDMRWHPIAALLLNGQVLIAGGQNSGGALASADLFDPVGEGTTGSTSRMTVARASGSAVALPNGMVLLVGGSTSATTELYNMDSDAFVTTGGMLQGDNGAVATLLNNGQVLVAGLTSGSSQSDAELYSPSFNPLGLVNVSSSEVTDTMGTACILAPSTSTASTCATTLTATTIATSPRTVTGLYPADGAHQQSSNSVNLSVTSANTGTTVSASAVPAAYGQSVTFTATVTNQSLGAAAPTGTVQFVVDGVNFGSPVALSGASANSGTATSQATATLPVAGSPHNVTANFINADGSFTPSTATLTGGLTVIAASTTSTVVSSISPSAFGQSVVFTATVSDSSGGSTAVPTGTVQFVVDGVNFGSPVALTGASSNSSTATSQATALLTVVGSPHVVSASYVNADSNFSNSTASLTGGQIVTGASTSTTVTSSQNSSAFGQSATFTATISAVAPGTGTPTGTVSFLDGGNPIGSGPLVGGVAQFSTSTLAAGNHTITTSYAGDGSFLGSTGAMTGNPQVVVAPPALSVVFNPTAIAVAGTTQLQFTLTNPAANTVALLGVGVTDVIPAGLSIANSTATACGGTLTTSTTGTITLTGATIGVNGSCQFAVTVTGSASAQYSNTAGKPTSTNGGAGATATAALTVASPPTVSIAFGAASVQLNGSTSLTFTIVNPNAGLAASGISLSDVLPAGLSVASPNGLTNTCGGTVTAVGGSESVSMAGATLPISGSCTLTVNVTGVSVGLMLDTTSPISSTQGGLGATSNTASLVVLGPPSISAAFGAASVQLTGSTTLTFSITNPNTTLALNGVAFSTSLPSELNVATPSGLTNTCGGTASATGATISLSGGSVAANTVCTVALNVTSVQAGTAVDSTSAISSTNGGTGNTATATLTVLAPDMTVAVSNGDSFRQGDASDSYTITVSNVGNSVSTGTVTIVDALPTGLTAKALSGAGWNCTLASLNCSRSDGLSAGSSYPALTLTVSVASSAPAQVTESVSVSGGGELNTANDSATDITTVTQVADITVTSTHVGSWVQEQAGDIYTLTVTNIGPGPTVGTVTVADTLPSGLTATSLTGAGWACTLSSLTCTRSDVLASDASYPVISLVVTVGAMATSPELNSVAVSGGGELNTTNDSSTDSTTIAPPSITLKSSGTIATLSAGDLEVVQFTLASNVNLTGNVSVTCQTSAPHVTCTVTPNQVSAVTGGTPFQVQIQTSGHYKGTVPELRSMNRRVIPYAAVVLGLPAMLLAVPQRRKRAALRTLFVMLVVIILMLAMSGCGTSTSTPPGTYTVTVSASISTPSGTITSTSPVTFIVGGW
jgi:hypothetical protein